MSLLFFAIFLTTHLYAQSPASIATLTSPADRTTVDDTTVRFEWNAVSNAQAYYVYVGTGLGLKDSFDSAELSATTVTASALRPSTTYYVRLWTKLDGYWKFRDTTFNTGTGVARLTLPLDGATNVDPAVAIQWNAVQDAETYYLYVGSAPGLQDVFGSGETLKNSVVVPALKPQTTYYARIWTRKNGAWRFTDSTFTTGTGLARLINPADRANDVDPLAPFTWNPVQDATAYFLYVGTAPGLKDVDSVGETLALSKSVRNLKPNTNYCARLWTKKSGRWYFVDTTFLTGTGVAHIVYPPNDASNVDPQSQFQWTAVPDAQAYYLQIGSTQGSKDAFESGELTTTTAAVSGLTPGKKYFLRLFTRKGDQWHYIDSTFQSGTGLARITVPANASTDVDPLVASVTWSAVADAQTYYLYLGTQPGLKDVVNSGETLATQYALPKLEKNTTYYARIWTKKGGVWRYTESTFATGTGIAHLSNIEGSQLVDPLQPFTWNAVDGASAYYLQVGTTVGAKDMFDSAELPVNVTQRVVSSLLPDTSYHARLWTKKEQTWRYEDVAFRTAPAHPLPEPATFYATVEELTAAVRALSTLDNDPIPDSDLAKEAAVWGRTKAMCSDYAAVLVARLAQKRILSRLRPLTIVGNFSAWHELVEYYDPFHDKWVVADPTFGVVYSDPDAGVGVSALELSDQANAQQWDAIKTKFVTGQGDSYMRNYVVDPLLLFLNVVPTGESPSAAAKNSALPFLTELTADETGGEAAYIVSFANESDSITVLDRSGHVQLTPIDNSKWSSVLWLREGWSLASELPSGAKLYRFKRVRF
ncbi:MAG TPA: hypothetical protein VD837_01095 [Terriglobales bacterium]|nr:hypothetical protein [Terriglobales bacterium]